MNPLEALRNRGANAGAPVKGPALNLTLGASIAAFLAAVVTGFNDTFEEIFPGGSVELKGKIMMTVIAAATVIIVADLLSRAIASVPRDLTQIAPAPKGWTASIAKSGKDDDGYQVAAMRFKDPKTIEYLLVKEGKDPSWRAGSSVVVKPPT